MSKKLFFSVVSALSVFFTAAAAEPQYRAPALENPDSWMMVVVPDTQTYIKLKRNHGIVELMNGWIVTNRDALRIQQSPCRTGTYRW